jgi:hypothetical protein
LTCTITELEHHNNNIIEKNWYMKSLRKAVFLIMEIPPEIQMFGRRKNPKESCNPSWIM